MKIEIKKPNGYLFDSDGVICFKFANWNIGEHEVPDYVDGRRAPEYSASQKLTKELGAKYK